MSQVVQHQSKGEAESMVYDQVDKTFKHSKLMFASVGIREDGAIDVDLTTWNFPFDKFREAQSLIRREIEKLVDSEIDNSPLPTYQGNKHHQSSKDNAENDPKDSGSSQAQEVGGTRQEMPATVEEAEKGREESGQKPV